MGGRMGGDRPELVEVVRAAERVCEARAAWKAEGGGWWYRVLVARLAELDAAVERLRNAA